MWAVRIYFGRSLGPKLSPVDRLLVRLGADLVFFAEPDRRALQLYSHSYIFSILDLAHLEHPEFPEVSLFGEFEAPQSSSMPTRRGGRWRSLRTREREQAAG